LLTHHKGFIVNLILTLLTNAGVAVPAGTSAFAKYRYQMKQADTVVQQIEDVSKSVTFPGVIAGTYDFTAQAIDSAGNVFGAVATLSAVDTSTLTAGGGTTPPASGATFDEPASLSVSLAQ
jgi:hypothetical protein